MRRLAVDTNVSSIFQPLYQHLQTIVRQLLTRVASLLVRMTEPGRVVFFLDTGPFEIISQSIVDPWGKMDG